MDGPNPSQDLADGPKPAEHSSAQADRSEQITNNQIFSSASDSFQINAITNPLDNNKINAEPEVAHDKASGLEPNPKGKA